MLDALWSIFPQRFSPQQEVEKAPIVVEGQKPSQLLGSIHSSGSFAQAWEALKELNPNRRGPRGYTLLHLATLWGTKEQLKELVENGALLDSKGAYGKTALELAKEQGRGDLVRQLERMGALGANRGLNRFRVVTVLERDASGHVHHFLDERNAGFMVLDQKTNDLYPNYNPTAFSVLDRMSEELSSVGDSNPCLMLCLLPIYMMYMAVFLPVLIFIGIIEAFFLMMARPAHVFALIVVTPFFTLGVMAVNLAKIVTDVGQIAIDIGYTGWNEGGGALLTKLSVSLAYEVPKALLVRIGRAVAAPFYGLWMMGASLQFLANPNQALVRLNGIEKSWDESGLLYAFRMAKVGNLGASKINGLAQFQLRNGL